MRGRFVALAILAPPGLLACSTIWGIKELPVAGSDGGAEADAVEQEDGPLGDSPSTAADAGCSCVGAPPTGWSGPLALYTSTTGVTPTCSGAYATAVYHGNADLNAPPAQCSCACAGPTTSGACSIQTVTFYTSGDCMSGLECKVVYDAFQTSFGSPMYCAAIDLSGCGGQVYGFTVDQAQLIQPACANPPTLGKVLPPPTWGTQAVACAAATVDAGACSSPSQVCAPPVPSSVPVCIVGSGSCPKTGPYTVEHDFYSDFQEGRDCDQCSSCQAVGGSCSLGGNYYIVNPASPPCGSGANAAAFGTITGPGCYPLNVSGTAAQGIPPGVYDGELGNNTWQGGTCEAPAASPTGTATPTGETTFCCTR